MPTGVYARPSLAVRFWESVDKHGHEPMDCWTWTGAKMSAGYGTIGNGKTAYAHRLSWEFAYGAIPRGLFVLHRCDNPPCVRPSHLFLGTQSDNMADCAQKGRAAGGERNGRARLTTREVTAIRKACKKGRRGTQRLIAKQYAISEATVSEIVHNKHYREASSGI